MIIKTKGVELIKMNKIRKKSKPKRYVIPNKMNMSYRQAKIIYGLSPHGDRDRDGVSNIRDCRPFNPRRQDIDPGDWMDTDEPSPKTKSGDWMATKKRRPKKARPVTSQKGDVITEALYGDEFKGEKYYKNYRITFYKHEKEFVVGSYEGHPVTDIYLPDIVYAHGFEQDPSSRWGEKQGKTIGTGKTITEAFKSAKQWIDKSG